MANCSADYYDYGGTDDSKFDKPLPWIGLYVAMTSLACGVLMAVDLFHNFKRRTPWVASKFFAFNATTLTLLGEATKLPSDITGGMPGLVDQLTKLSGVLLLRGAMDHAMASLGAMDGLAASYNMMAIGIMVVSMFVNIWIQLNSDVIFNCYFWWIYAYYSLDMLLLFLFLVSHVLSVFPSRKILYKQYYKIHEEILNEISVVEDSLRFSYDNLCKYVTGYWLMAVTSSPAYTLTTSQPAVASSCLNGYSSVLIFVFGIIFVYGKIKDGNNPMCFVRSYYSWSTWLIFVIQVFTIAVGCATSIQRMVRSILHREWTKAYDIEIYRVKFVMDWNDAPLPDWISNIQFQRAMHCLRRRSIDALVFLLRFVMITSTVIVVIHLCFAIIMIICRHIITICLRIIIIFCRSPTIFILRIFRWIFRMIRNFPAMESAMEIVLEWEILRRDNDVTESPYGDMSHYILYLTDEKNVEQSKKTARFLQKHPTKWINRGRANQPTNLDSLIRNNSLPEAFQAVREFYRKQISSREPPNCWAMPIVTFASILFLHGNSPRREELMLAVGESLRYIRLIDKNMDERGTGRMQKAAKKVWEKLYLQNRWSNIDRDQTSSMSFTALIIHLRDEAQNDLKQDGQCKSWEYWPQKVFITNCMYTTTQTILGRETEGSPTNLPWSVETLEKVIVGLLGACLTNLPLAIFKHCSSGTFGLREDKVKKAAAILGETRKIITLLENTGGVVDYPENNKEYFESWCERSPSPQSPVGPVSCC